jgi:hypothetical protein
MYRVTKRLADFQAEELAGRFCHSHSGCLRTILWTIDGKAPEKYLPRSKFDPQADQLGECRKENTKDGQAGVRPHHVPFLCVEACNLFVAEARKIVKVHSE